MRGAFGEASAPAEAPGFRRILVAIDFSEHSPLALANAREFARLWGGRLMLLHVVPQLVVPEFYLRVADLSLNLSSLREAARERLEDMAQRLRGEGLEVEVEARIGRPAPEIVAAATECGADLT